MKSPLLVKSNAPRLFQNRSLFLIFFTCSFFILLSRISRRNGRQSMKERDVGVAQNRFGMFHTYFTLGGYADQMLPGRNYPGPQTQTLTPFYSYCSAHTPLCDKLCQERWRTKRQSQQTESATCRNQFAFQQECWPTQGMRCWGLDKMVWDGREEWIVLTQDMKGESGNRWIHFRSQSQKAHFFLFGMGTGPKAKAYFDIAQMIIGSASLMRELTSGNQDDFWFFAGHSQGAAWAAATNFIMAESGVPEGRRHVIGTGAPLVEQQFHTEYYRDTNPQETNVFLLLALMQPTGVVFTDVSIISRASDKGTMTLNQFAYVCVNIAGILTCLDPQPSSSISISKTIELLPAETTIISFLSSFHTYQQCFLACAHVFVKRGVDFSPNIHSYTRSRRTPSTGGAGPSEPGPSSARAPSRPVDRIGPVKSPSTSLTAGSPPFTPSGSTGFDGFPINPAFEQGPKQRSFASAVRSPQPELPDLSPPASGSPQDPFDLGPWSRAVLTHIDDAVPARAPPSASSASAAASSSSSSSVPLPYLPPAPAAPVLRSQSAPRSRPQQRPPLHAPPPRAVPQAPPRPPPPRPQLPPVAPRLGPRPPDEEERRDTAYGEQYMEWLENNDKRRKLS